MVYIHLLFCVAIFMVVFHCLSPSTPRKKAAKKIAPAMENPIGKTQRASLAYPSHSIKRPSPLRKKNPISAPSTPTCRKTLHAQPPPHCHLLENQVTFLPPPPPLVVSLRSKFPSPTSSSIDLRLVVSRLFQFQMASIHSGTARPHQSSGGGGVYSSTSLNPWYVYRFIEIDRFYKGVHCFYELLNSLC